MKSEPTKLECKHASGTADKRVTLVQHLVVLLCSTYQAYQALVQARPDKSLISTTMDSQGLAIALDRFRFYARDAALTLSQVSLSVLRRANQANLLVHM